MVAAEVRSERRTGAYWRDLVFGRVLPALFFSLFVANQVLQLSETVQGARTFSSSTAPGCPSAAPTTGWE